MKSSARPELPIVMDCSAPLSTRPDSTYKSGKVVQTNGTTSQDNSPEQIEDRLGMLEEDLHLAPGQQAAWQACMDKIAAYATDIGREQTRGSPAAASLSSLQLIDHAVDVSRNRLTALEDIAAAARTLYATLNAQQKSIVDPRLANIVTSISNPVRDSPPRAKSRP